MIDQVKAKQLLDKMSALMNEFAEVNGLKKGKTRLTYRESTLKFAIEFGEAEAAGDHPTEYLRDMERFGFTCGLTKDAIGKRVTILNGPGTFVGMRSRRWLIVKADVDGKYYRIDTLNGGAITLLKQLKAA